MLSPIKIMASAKACLWADNIVGTLLIWKLGEFRFQAFSNRVIPDSEVVQEDSDFDSERVIVETMVAMAIPPCYIQVQRLVEVEVLVCDSQEAIVLHRERTEEVDYMIDFIDAVERQYWGNTFM